MQIDLTLTGSLACELGAWANCDACDSRKFIASAALVALIPFALLETITRLALAAILYLSCSHSNRFMLDGTYETAIAIPNVFSQLICRRLLDASSLGARYFSPAPEDIQAYLAKWRAERVQHLIEQNNWVRQSLKTATGNSSLTDARIVFLADTNHASIDVQENIEKFIESVALEGDVLLLEGNECLAPVSLPRFKHLRVYGWDNEKLVSQCIQDALKFLLTSYERFKLDKQLNSFTRAQKLLPGGEKAHSQLQQKIQRTANLRGRNCSLLRAVDESSTQINSFSKIFVRSGRGHFTPELMAKFEKQRHIVVTFEAPVSTEKARSKESLEYLKGLILRNCDLDAPTRATLDELFANDEFWAESRKV